MSIRSAVSSAVGEVVNFGHDLRRLVSRDAALATRACVIGEIAGLAIAAYGIALVGFGIAACATGVGIPAGLFLIAKGVGTSLSGWDLYKQSSNIIKYKISLQRLDARLFEGTFARIVLNIYLRCRGRPQLA